MKKILLALTIIFLSACSLMGTSSPKQVVSSFLDKYKNQDTEVLTQLDDTINREYTNETYRSRYRNLMTNQYKNMEYKIKDEIIEDDNAVVEVEVTVYDYASSIRNSNEYLNSHSDEFMIKDKATINEEDKNDETTKDDVDTEDKMKDNNTNNSLLNSYDEDKFTDYKLTQMENVNDTVTYTLEFTLTKVDNKWQMDSLSNADIEKIHGIYIQG